MENERDESCESDERNQILSWMPEDERNRIRKLQPEEAVKKTTFYKLVKEYEKELKSTNI
jgi:hypothetical protein